MTDETIRNIAENAAVAGMVMTLVICVTIYKIKKLSTIHPCENCGELCAPGETLCEDCR